MDRSSLLVSIGWDVIRLVRINLKYKKALNLMLGFVAVNDDTGRIDYTSQMQPLGECVTESNLMQNAYVLSSRQSELMKCLYEDIDLYMASETTNIKISSNRIEQIDASLLLTYSEIGAQYVKYVEDSRKKASLYQDMMDLFNKGDNPSGAFQKQNEFTAQLQICNDSYELFFNNTLKHLGFDGTVDLCIWIDSIR